MGTVVEAVVKWFNPTKGFGFVAPSDGSADAFLHMSVLGRAGLSSVAEGAKLLTEIGDGQKGRQVLRVIEVRGTAPIPQTAPSGAPHPVATGPTETLEGTVKWFKGDKGFGFITPDDGGKDVFVHKSVLLRAGLSSVEPGQKVKMQVHVAAKGREAVEIFLV
jgi:CspA family cold shock protein